MKTTAMFGTPGHPIAWGSVLPSRDTTECGYSPAVARPRNLRAADLTIDHCRSTRERIPDS